jgi:hypothetical protein
VRIAALAARNGGQWRAVSDDETEIRGWLFWGSSSSHRVCSAQNESLGDLTGRDVADVAVQYDEVPQGKES